MKYVLIIAVAFAVMVFLDYTGNENAGEEKKSPAIEKWKGDQCEAEFYAVMAEVDRRMQHAMFYGNRQAILMYQPMAYRLADIQREMFTRSLNGGGYDSTVYGEEIRAMRDSLKQ